MKISGGQADRFCRQDHPELAAVLLFGADSGLVQERNHQLTAAVLGPGYSSDAVERVDRETLKTGAGGSLSDRASQMSLIAGRRVIQLVDASEWAKSAVQTLADNQSGDALVVATASEMKTSSGLRKLFESHAKLAAINCFADDERALRQVIQDWARGLGRPLDRDAQQLLESQLGANRQMTRSELEKLSLYLMSESEGAPIKREAVLACFSDVKKVDLSDPVLAAFGGKPARALAACAQLRGDGKSPDAVLAVFNTHLGRLVELQNAQAQGISIPDAVGTLRPPVFFSLKPLLIAQAQRWQDSAQLTAIALQAAETLERLRLPQVDSWCEIEKLLMVTSK